jgi:hypothetical protein
MGATHPGSLRKAPAGGTIERVMARQCYLKGAAGLRQGALRRLALEAYLPGPAGATVKIGSSASVAPSAMAAEGSFTGKVCSSGLHRIGYP